MSKLDLLSKKMVRKNTLWNLSGQVLPMLVVVFVIPILWRNLGTERFGLLTIVWMVTGYFSLFDLGLGRALTQYVAQEQKMQTDPQELNEILRSTIGVLVAMGLILMAVLFPLSSQIIENFYRVGVDLKVEGISAVRWVAISLPLIIATTGLRGILEGAQRFDMVNVVRVPMSVVSYLAPAIVSEIHPDLGWVVFSILAFRALNCLIYWRMVQNLFGKFQYRTPHRLADVYRLLRLGGWLTVTNIMNPLLVQIDRLIIGGIVPVATLAFYTTPSEMMTKFWILPIAVAGVLFPTFAATFYDQKSKALVLFEKSYVLVFGTMLVGVLVLSFFASNFLKAWLNPEFAIQGTIILQIIGWGVVMQGAANVPMTFLQSIGRPELTAKTLLCEFVVFVACSYWATRYFGLLGTALVWSIRMTLDWAVMLLLSHRFLIEIKLQKYFSRAIFGLAMYALTAWASRFLDFKSKIIFFMVLCLVGAILAVLTGFHRRIRENLIFFLK